MSARPALPALPALEAAPQRKPAATATLLAAAAACAVVFASSIWFSGTLPSPTEGDGADRLARAHGTELLSRLRLADRVLRAIAADLAERGHETALLGATEKRYFEAVAYARAGEPSIQLLGTASAVPELKDPMPEKLGNGESVITAAADNGAATRVSVVRRVPRTGTPGALLIAELAPQYLWEVAGSRPEAAALCVRDAGGTTLHCSSPRALSALRSLGKDLPGASGTLDWRSDDGEWSGAYVRVDLPERHPGDGWTVLAIESKSAAGPGMRLAPGLGSALSGATLFALLVAFVIARRRRGTRDAPARGENPVAVAGRAAGDSVDTAEPPARILLMLDRQRRAIRAMADIDRAMLSRASVERLIELAAGHLLACTGCDVLVIGVLDRDVSSRMRVVLAPKGGGEMLVEQNAIDPSATRLLSIPSDGTWVHRVSEFALFEAQAQRGANGALVLPIYEDAKPVGIMSLGFTGDGMIGTDESSNARAIASRLGTALTSAARAQALYAHTHFDATTALPNRQYLKEHLAQQMKRARRDRVPLAVLFVDLDRFKQVNGSSGHSRGDMVLAEAARRLRACVREEDLVTRFGGDEFVVVLPKVAEGMLARRVADKLHEALAKPFLVEGEEHHLGCSIGISLFPDDAQSVEELLRSADSAMFDAKAAGRGRYAFFDSKVNRAALERTGLERDLRRALANAEFTVVYQPQIDLRSGSIDGAEALVRWRHPTRGMVPPGEFIAVAEQAGLIAQLDEFVMRTACAQFRVWDAEGIAPQRVAVNVSGLEIARPDFVERVEGVLRDTGMRPLFLELEITEGMFLDDSGANLAKLKHIQQRGVRIAVDDFGTGYSSLRYLKRLPIDVVKIDQSFVRDLGADRDSESIVRAIIEVAHSLGKSVVAEGVETEQQRALLDSWGCDVGQGYLWSRPLGASEFESFCRERPALQQQNLSAAR